ncbi:MAG: carboxypeptidase regulatory-like domain-containing protein [Gammaproteobacteria bacterium]|nr:carboxypeptidase regulatory-like domain-containing protein [Gammaproteobacteria bacterium]
MMHLAGALVGMLLVAAGAGPASAAVLEGVVSDAHGAPVSGALVTLSGADGLYGETVYSGRDGSFRLDSGQDGALGLRARAPGFADATQKVRLNAARATRAELRLERLETAAEISAQLTAAAQFTRVRLADPGAQKMFQNDCLSCHQLGNAFTRTPRTQEQWAAIVRRMFGYWVMGYRDVRQPVDESLIDEYAGLLSRAFDGSLVTIREGDDYDARRVGARIQEWKLPGALVAHDATVRRNDRHFYTVDQGTDQIYITDPESNRTEIFDLPAAGLPPGGRVAAALGISLGGSAARRAPHSLQEGPDGRLYTTDSFANQIGVFDPRTRSYTAHDIGAGAMYPHTLRFDGRGRVWFTILMSNQLGRFDPASGEMVVIDLPRTSRRPDMPALAPYGIDVSPTDGSIWYSRLGAHRIGRIDPETLAVQEFDPPLVGPRRLRFSADGMLWIPAFGDGAIVRLDPRTMAYRTYLLPRLAPGEVEAPYALAVQPQTQEIWVTANMSDRMFRFLPGEERFIVYPLPTRGTYLRDIFFTDDGRACGPSSPVPVPAAVEQGLQAIVCIDPGDDAADRGP